MVPDPQDYRCIFPDDSIAIPAEMTTAGDILAEKFPEERDGIARVLLIMESLIDEADKFVPAFRVAQRPGDRRLFDPVMEQFQRRSFGAIAGRIAQSVGAPGANLLKYQTRTLPDLLNEHLKSPRLKGYFSMLCAGIGAAPSGLSAIIAGVFFIHALRTMWMPRGGFGKLAEALAEMFQERGGTLLTGCEAPRILVNAGHVTAIESVDARRFYADTVVSPCDARRTFLQMLEPQGLPADLRAQLPRTPPA